MTHTVLQVYWYWDEVSGDFHHRIERPGHILNRSDALEVTNIHLFHPLFPSLALKADLIIFHLLFQPELAQLIKLRRRDGKVNVFEIPDNFLKPGSWISADNPFRNPYIRQNFLHYAQICDGLQVSSPQLARVFGFLNENFQVVENQVDVPETASLSRSGPFVFGWGGSQGHAEDLEMVAPAILRFCQTYPDTQFAYMGNPRLYESLFSSMRQEQKRYQEPGSMQQWLDFVSGLHVGLAPLIDTEFNHSRSDGKFLEYAAMGTPACLSDVSVYQRHREHALLFRSPDELFQALSELYTSRAKRESLAAKAFDYVVQSRSSQTQSQVLTRYYQDMLGDQPGGSPIPELPPCTRLIGLIRRAMKHYYAGHYARGLQILEEAVSANPDYQLADLWIMRCLNKLGDEGRQQLLAIYSELVPHPIFADLFYENLYLAAEESNPSLATKWLATIEDPVRRIHLAPPIGSDREALFRQVLKHKPYDYFATEKLYKILRRRPDSPPEYVETLHRNLRMIEGKD